MKWIKTKEGNLVRLGAVTEFEPRYHAMWLHITGAQDKEELLYQYNSDKKCRAMYEKLCSFIMRKEDDGNILIFDEEDENEMFAEYDIRELFGDPARDTRIVNALKRSDISTVYDLIKRKERGKVRNIGEDRRNELIKQLDEFVDKRKPKTIRL